MDSFGGKEKELASGAPAKTDKLFLGLKNAFIVVLTREEIHFSRYLTLFIGV